jgi:hypothetical protein
MSHRTDSPEFAPGFIWQIILLTFVVLCFALYSRGQEGSIGKMGVASPTSIFPWMIGGKQTIENGLRAFSGKPPEPPPVGDRAKALGPVLITLVLCPTVFFLEWRRRRLAKAPGAGRPPLRISRPFYALCGLVTVFVAVAVGPIAFFGEISRADLRHAQAVQGNRDLMINELNILAVDAAQYFILPKSFGGGGRSFIGYSVPQTNAKTEGAFYTVTATKNAAAFRATSTRFPSCAIQVKVDSLGHMREWIYEGEFR